MAVGVRDVKPVFGKYNGLNDRKALRGPRLEVEIGLLAGEPVEEFPGSVAEVEERRSIVVNEEAPIWADL